MSEHEDGPAAGKDRGSGGEPVDGIDRPRAWLTGAGLGALVLAAMVIAFMIGTNYSDDPVEVATADGDVPALPKDLSGPGQDLFVARCGGCHKLADAGTSGTAGPDLDKLAPEQGVIEQAIAQGGTGSGMMPPGLATGEEATQVAEYIVAATSGD